MKFRILSVLLMLALLPGCPVEKKDKKGAKGKNTTTDAPRPTKDDSGDVAFQSFVGRLRLAVEKRDVPMLSQMMTPDFGYRWEQGPADETPFAYWDQHNLWGELASLMKDQWTPYDGFMVVPSSFPKDPNFGGYRAGVQMVNGSWRFAYFVSPPPQ